MREWGRREGGEKSRRRKRRGRSRRRRKRRGRRRRQRNGVGYKSGMGEKIHRKKRGLNELHIAEREGLLCSEAEGRKG